MRRRRLLRPIPTSALLAGCAFLLVLCPGCVWLQNEFFVYDAAPPPTEPPPAAHATEPPR